MDTRRRSNLVVLQTQLPTCDGQIIFAKHGYTTVMSLEVPARAPTGRRGHDKQRATLHNIQSYNDLFDWIHFTQKQIQGFTAEPVKQRQSHHPYELIIYVVGY